MCENSDQIDIVKYRIIHDKNDNYRVQYKLKGMLQPWRRESISPWDVEDVLKCFVNGDGSTSSYSLAYDYMTKEVHKLQKIKRSKIFTIAREVNV